MSTDIENTEAPEEAVLDKAALEAEIVARVRAFTKLLNHATDDWTS
jgi:hypothetical protein